MTESTPDTGTQNTEPERANPSSGNSQTAPAAEGDTAPTEQQPGAGGGGSAATGSVDDSSPSGGGQPDPTGVSDDELPEDLRPTDDNPLAKPADVDDDGEGGMNLQEQAGDAAPPA